MSEENITYYRQTMPKLIDRYKLMIDECLQIVGQKIDGDLSDDKMHNVIKAKKMAAETAQWGALQIDTLTDELNATDTVVKSNVNFSEQLAE